LQSEESDYKIEILGINWDLSDESGNDLMTAEGNLPWLQDTNEVNAQELWEAEYRDVIILDAGNRPIEPAFNLTVNDLAVEANRKALLVRLRKAAAMVDVDGDRIADDWESRYLMNLTEDAGDDFDQDGENLMVEYALGSRPDLEASLPKLTVGTMVVDDEERFFVTFRRRLGAAGGLTYTPELKGAGTTWINASDRFILSDRRNPFDGTGTEIVTYVLAEAVAKAGLFRIRVGFPE
jgi:hypothetical protein